MILTALWVGDKTRTEGRNAEWHENIWVDKHKDEHRWHLSCQMWNTARTDGQQFAVKSIPGHWGTELLSFFRQSINERLHTGFSCLLDISSTDLGGLTPSHRGAKHQTLFAGAILKTNWFWLFCDSQFPSLKFTYIKGRFYIWCLLQSRSHLMRRKAS